MAAEKVSGRAATAAPVRWGETEIRGPVHLYRERILLGLLRVMQPAGRILDAGCGSGSLAFALCRAGYRVEAVEASPEFVARVAERSVALGLAGVLRVQPGTVGRLDFGNGEFDGAVCAEVLEHLGPRDGGDRGAVRELARVVRPGGVCLASVPLNPALWDPSDDWAGHVKRYTPSEMVALFTGAGFVPERVRYWGFPLGRIYHRLLFAPWIRRAGGQAAAEREGRADTRAGTHPLVVRLAAALLRLDNLFARWPWGRGMILGGRRH
ncbi:MAG: methyltransferase domain-containing protein [Candidatus Latescibacterota bacterium]